MKTVFQGETGGNLTFAYTASAVSGYVDVVSAKTGTTYRAEGILSGGYLVVDKGLVSSLDPGGYKLLPQVYSSSEVYFLDEDTLTIKRTPDFSSTLVVASGSNIIARLEALEANPPGGVTDHGALTGLADDDHTQYHNDARGDARYWQLSTDLATQAELDARLSATDATDLTDTGDTTLHFHSADRAWANITGKPTTLAGYGITDAASDSELAAHEADTTNIHGIADTNTLVTTSTLTELVQDIVGAFSVAGTNISVTYDDTANTLTFAVTGLTSSSLSDFTEAVQDVIGATTLGGSGLTFTYNDPSNTLTIDVNVDNSTIEVSTDTLRVKDAGITFAKIQNLTTNRLIGRDTAGTGPPEELTVTGGLEFSGTSGIIRSALTGDVTASAGSNATTIANDAVTYAKIQNVSATDKLLGRVSTGAGDVEEVTFTDFAQSLVDDTDAATARTTLELGSAAVEDTTAFDAAGTAASAVATHEADTTNVHGITDTSTLYRSGGTDVALADGGTGASLADPNADRIIFWDDSAGAVTWLAPGTNLSITGTTLNATGGGGATAYWVSVKDYGAVGDGTTDDTTAIQNAFNAVTAGGIIVIPSGTYRISAPLTMTSQTGVTIVGVGRVNGSETGSKGSKILASGYSGDSFTFTDCSAITLRDFWIHGEGQSAANAVGGIRFIRSSANNNIAHIIENVLLKEISTQGIVVDVPVTTHFKNVEVRRAAKSAFVAVSGTSTTYENCYALTNNQAGFDFFTMTYSTLEGCAAELCGISYNFASSRAITMAGCGTEDATNRSGSYPGYGWQAQSSYITLVGCYSRASAGGDFNNSGGNGLIDRYGFRDNTAGTVTTKVNRNIEYILSGTGPVVIDSVDGTSRRLITASGRVTVSGATYPTYTEFTTPGTTSYTIPVGATAIRIAAVGGGGGGGAGRRDATSTAKFGGGGGGGGAYAEVQYDVNEVGGVGTSLVVVVGSGGVGGQAQTSNTSDGANGTAGGASFINTAAGVTILNAPGGNLGSGGTSAAGSAGAATTTTSSMFIGEAGGASSTSATAAGGTSSARASGGGGGGGGVDGSNNQRAGGSGANGGRALTGATTTNGTNGSTPGGNGGPATNHNLPTGGPGGGGGAGHATGVGGTGGNGVRGGGGGGGGASLNGNNSGAGGNGGDGYIRITVW